LEGKLKIKPLKSTAVELKSGEIFKIVGSIGDPFPLPVGIGEIRAISKTLGFN